MAYFGDIFFANIGGWGWSKLFATSISLEQELMFAKGMRTAIFQFSESRSSLNGPDLFTELPFP